MVAIAKQVPETVTLSTIITLAPAIPHLREVAEKSIDWKQDENFIWFYTGLGRFYQSQSVYTEAEKWFKEAVELTKNCLPE